MDNMCRNFFYICNRYAFNAEIAQSVEHQLPKLRVASSNLVFRSLLTKTLTNETKNFIGKDGPMAVLFHFRPATPLTTICPKPIPQPP